MSAIIDIVLRVEERFRSDLEWGRHVVSARTHTKLGNVRVLAGIVILDLDWHLSVMRVLLPVLPPQNCHALMSHLLLTPRVPTCTPLWLKRSH